MYIYLYMYIIGFSFIDFNDHHYIKRRDGNRKEGRHIEGELKKKGNGG